MARLTGLAGDDEVARNPREIRDNRLDSRIRAGFPMCPPQTLTQLGIDLPALQSALAERTAAQETAA